MAPSPRPSPRGGSGSIQTITTMDPGPQFHPETTSVSFYVRVRGMHVKSFVTRDWLLSRFGPDIPADAGMVDAYLAHAATIDGEVARRVAAGRMEPVWLASALPPLT